MVAILLKRQSTTDSPTSSPDSPTDTPTETTSSEPATPTETTTASSEVQTSSSASTSEPPTTTMSSVSDSTTSLTSVSSSSDQPTSDTDVTSPTITTTTTDTTSDTSVPPTTDTTTTEPTTTTSDPPTTTQETSTLTTTSVPPETTESTSTLPPSTSTSTTVSSDAVQTPTSTTVIEASTTFVAQETTLSSTVFFTVTSGGQTMTSAPSEFTSTLTSTNSAGEVSTITQIAVNPTLSSGDDGGNSEFFKNKGAVAGVFLIIGLAAASICIWIIFSVRRRRRRRLLEREAAIAAPSGHRSPLEDEDDEPKMAQNTLAPVTSHPPSAYFDDGPGHRVNESVFDPYVGYAHHPGGNVGRIDGYVPARTSSPPPGGDYRLGGHHRQPSANSNSNTSGENGAHSRTYSFSSYEPLLAAAGIGNKTPPDTPGPTQLAGPSGSGSGNGRAPTPPPRSPLRPSLSKRPEGDEAPDERLDPTMGARLTRMDTSASGIRDDQDYSRPVLGVRNLPSNVSISEYSDNGK